MPRATVVLVAERRDLTTVEGGYVELRRLSFGEKLRKDAEAMKMRLAMDTSMKDVNAEVSMINEAVTLREFALCVVGHNLTKPSPADPDNREADIPIDFKKPSDVQSLDPRVGDEISTLIGEMNDFERQAEATGVDAKGK